MTVDLGRLLPNAPPEALQQAGDFLDIGVLTIDGDQIVRGWNRWLEAASGWSAAEVVGRSLLELFPGIAGSRAEQAFCTALAGETVIFAHRFHRYLLPLPASPGFEEFPQMQQSARITPLVTDEGIRGAIAVIQDVTDRVAREEELKRAMKAAEDASQAKSEFLAAMSHELRTPLNGMIGYAELLLTEVTGPLPEVQKGPVRRIKAGAWHLLGIIEEILTFARVEAGKEEVHLDNVDVVQLSRDGAALLLPQATAKRLDLRMSLPPEPIVVQTDPGKLRQILLNLIGNAVKFTSEGEVELRVWKNDDSVFFVVRDTGPGIPLKELDRVFEPFTQIDQSRTRTQGGTGLGLPVSRKLAHLLGGEVMLESQLGEGSSFTLQLPLVPRLPVIEPEQPVL
jgi:signal transduction histidine kinase